MTPLIFEGLQSIYKDARKTCNEEQGTCDLLKIFQSYLRQIPKWTQDILNNESNRITNSSQSYGWLNDLIKATLKANLVILMHNPTCNKQVKIDHSYYQNIRTSEFIHKVYIECARELYNNPAHPSGNSKVAFAFDMASYKDSTYFLVLVRDDRVISRTELKPYN